MARLYIRLLSDRFGERCAALMPLFHVPKRYTQASAISDNSRLAGALPRSLAADLIIDINCSSEYLLRPFLKQLPEQ